MGADPRPGARAVVPPLAARDRLHDGRDRPHRVRDRPADPARSGPRRSAPRPLQIGLLTASYAVMQLIFAPVWGRLSDRYGRRPVILVSLAGSAVAALLIGVAGTLLVLFVARVLQGIAGASYAAAQAYVADVTTPRDRARGMGLIGAAFGLGFVLGPRPRRALLGGRPAPAVLRRRGPGGRQPADRLPAPARVAPRRRRRAAPAPRLGLLRRALSRRELAPARLAVSFIATFAFVGMESTFALFGERRFELRAGGDGAPVHLHRRAGGAVPGGAGGEAGRALRARPG